MHSLRVHATDVFAMTIACVALLALGYALGTGGSTLIAIVVLIAGAGAATLIKFDMSRLLLLATSASAFATGVPEFYVGPVRARLALVVLVLVLAIASFVRGSRLWLPWWLLAPAGAIVLASGLVLMFPISLGYLNSRITALTFGPPATGDIGPAASALLSLVGIPLGAIICSRAFQRAPLWIAGAFVAGNALSALVAYTDFLGLTSLSATFGGCGVPGGRACGFSAHPVILTIGTVYSTGLAAWFLVRPSARSRIFGGLALPALVLGTYASGSRGGVLSILFLLAASVLILPQYRRRIHLVMLGTATAASVVFVISPGLGHQLLKTTRFVDSPTAAGSNQARIEAMSQGWKDFLESPVYGIGLNALFQAQNGYIQSLAAGGLILLVGILALQLGALWEAFRLMRSYSMATALAATMLTRIGYEAIEGALVVYAGLVPIALIAALLAQRRAADSRAHAPPSSTTDVEVPSAGDHRDAARHPDFVQPVQGRPRES